MRQIDYVSTTALTPIEPYTEHGGGGFKKLVAVAAMVAIPIAAPAIAGSIGLSTAIGSVMASGLVGAGLGAAVGSYTGQGMKAGALMGALSGGLAGYSNPGTSAGGVENQAFSGESFRPDAYQNSVYADAYGPGAIDPVSGNYVTDASVNQQQASTFVGGGDTTANSLNNTRVDGLGASQNTVTTNATANQGGIIQANYPGGSLPQPPNANTFTAATAPGVSTPLPRPSYETMLDAGYSPAQLKNYAGSPNTPMFGDNVFGNTMSEIGNRFTDPTKLADVSIQAGINLIGAEIMGVGKMSDEEKELLAMQKQQMEDLKAKDEKAYNFAMAQAKKFLKLGDDFDPQQIARQAYGKAASRAGLAKRDALRKINPSNSALRAAEERRFDLGTAANTGSAYDRGMIQGLNQQANYLNKASAAYPSSGGSYSSALTGLQQTYANLAQKKSNAQKGVNQMFGSFGLASGDGNDDYRAGLRDAFGSFYS
jgi:hypothetical protein